MHGLKEKGNPEKLIKVAIAHKFIRQIFEIIKRGDPFSESYA